MNGIKPMTIAAALLLGTPALAATQGVAYQGFPVSVTSCSVDAASPSANILGEGGGATVAVSNIALSFVNHNNVPATTVRIVVDDGRYTQWVVDKGSFAPQVRIAHTFLADGGMRAAQSCNVAEVEFADGSAWQAGLRNVVRR